MQFPKLYNITGVHVKIYTLSVHTMTICKVISISSLSGYFSTKENIWLKLKPFIFLFFSFFLSFYLFFLFIYLFIYFLGFCPHKM